SIKSKASAPRPWQSTASCFGLALEAGPQWRASRVGMRWSLPFDGRCGSVSPMSLTTRFAPSPTGYLHLGHAFSACNAWEQARDGGGRFLLRLEDIDPTRCRQAFSEAIQEDLAWLGIN